MNTKPAIALCALPATPACATNYVINLDTGNYGAITASGLGALGLIGWRRKKAAAG
jgi:hypothetical protein